MNVEKDATERNLLNRYVVTANTARTVNRVVAAARGQGIGAWTLTGPFGTGKSACCIFIAQLLGGDRRGAMSRQALKKLQDSDVAGSVLDTEELKGLRLAVFAATGQREAVGQTLLRAIVDSPAAGSAPASIRSKAKRMLKLYKDGGQANPADILALLDDLSADSGSVLVVLDELGKNLEWAAGSPAASDIYLLQQVAELATRSEGRLMLLTVLHQDFRAYAAGLPAADRAEWEKIRGRFEDLIFEEPADQLLRIVAQAWATLRTTLDYAPGDVDSLTRRLASRLFEHGAAPTGLDFKADGDLLAKSAPFHPLVAALLGPLFRRLGQNERSAFSFLQSQEPGSVQAFCRLDAARTRVYDLADLFEYLVASLSGGLLHTAEGKRWAELLEAEARNPTLSPDAVYVLRTVGLMGMVGRWYPVRPTRELLCFALEGRLDATAVDMAIDELLSANVVVHRKFNDSFVIWEGSDIDIAERLEEARSRLRKTTAVAAMLRRHFSVRPLLARRHAFQTGTLRFFDVTFARPDELAPQAESIESGHDGSLVVVLGDSAASVKKLPAMSAQTLVRVPETGGSLHDAALELAAIDWVRRHTPELASDGAARRELQTRRTLAEREVESEIDQMLRVRTGEGSWIYKGETIEVPHGRALSEVLSQICDAVFRHAPIIDNEIINRRDLSSAGAAARGQLLKAMIENEREASLGLTGNPPERSIYRSILSAEGGLGIHRAAKSADFAFRVKPPKKDDKQARETLKAIDDFVMKAGSERRSLAELLQVLREPPYGIRDGVIPLLVTAVLLARRNDVAIYEDDAFTPEWSAAMFDRLVKDPATFSVKRWKISGVRANVFAELAKLLNSVEVDATGASDQILGVVRPLVRFVASLPEHVRLTKNVTSKTAAVRDALLEASEPDELIFVDLPKACGLKPFIGTKARGKSGSPQQFAKELQNAITELREVMPSTVERARGAIIEAFNLPDDQTAMSVLRERAEHIQPTAVDRDLKQFVGRVLLDEDADDIVRNVATLAGERPIEKWRDEDEAACAVRLQQMARRFILLESVVSDQNRTRRKPARSVRVAITDSDRGQADRFVHLSKAQQAKASKLATKLSSTLIETETDKSVLAAALCEILGTLHDQEAQNTKETAS